MGHLKIEAELSDVYNFNPYQSVPDSNLVVSTCTLSNRLMQYKNVLHLQQAGDK